MKTIQEPGLLGGSVFRFQVRDSLAGQRLSREVARMVKELSVRGAKGLVDRGRVFVDSKRVLKASFVLSLESLNPSGISMFSLRYLFSPVKPYLGRYPALEACSVP